MADEKRGKTGKVASRLMLADVVTLDRRFHRSVRVDHDLGEADAVEGYILQNSAVEVVQEISRSLKESRQRAFTLTGPYGGGKSSLALVLGDFVSPNVKLRQAAENVLGPNLSHELREALPTSKGGWLVLPVQGRRANPVADLAEVLASATGDQTYRTLSDGKALVQALESTADDIRGDGTLIIVDELGKYLEAVANGHGDIHFFQELAEMAGRARSPIVVLGILHQAFEAYVSKFGREVRDEWAKVQGRFVDIPLRSSPDETLYLIGKAIKSDVLHPLSGSIASRVASQIRLRRVSAPKDLEDRLDACWPLHPMVPVLLGAFSRKRFGQNERSIFGFLTSQEPFGLQHFLNNTYSDSSALYAPWNFWDYLKSNLEPTILASTESHRWATAVHTVSRAEGSGDSNQVLVAKTIAVLDYLNPGDPGADLETLCACLPDIENTVIQNALSALEAASAIFFRKHLNSWAVFAGSDFSLNTTLAEVKEKIVNANFIQLSRLAPMGPIVAKRHYHQTGALRWFSFDLVSVAELNKFIQRNEGDGRVGRFLLVLPSSPEEATGLDKISRKQSKEFRERRVVIGAPRNAGVILDLGWELLALHQIRSEDPRLQGDEVARREVAGHIADVELRLENELQEGCISAHWFLDGNCIEVRGKDTLTELASSICDQWYSEAPVIFSELVNRHKPTRNSQAGVRELLNAMVANPKEMHLGITLFPAERGLYDTVLVNAGLHRLDGDGEYGFFPPDPFKSNHKYGPFWEAGEDWLRGLKGLKELTSLRDLFDLWNQPPFGVHEGVLPILGLAFLLNHIDEVAIHSDGVFQTEETLRDGTFVDCLFNNASRIQVRYVPPADPQRQKWLGEISQSLCAALGRSGGKDALLLARQLKGFSTGLHPWVLKTKRLSKAALSLRNLLHKAADPNQLLFTDLPHWQQEHAGGTSLKKVLPDIIGELGSAYESMLRTIEQSLWDALGAGSPPNLANLATRAERVHGVSGDLRMDAFADRLARYEGTLEQLEGLCGFALNKPTRDWLGTDPDQAKYHLIELADRFRKAETFAEFCGKEVGRQGLALIVREGKSFNTLIQYFDVGDEDRGSVNKLVASFRQSLDQAGLNPRLKLAALAAVTADILSDRAEGKE